MDRIIRLQEFLEKNDYIGWQVFNTKNISGDFMETIYEQDGITVDVCRGWHYLEIFGLTEEEFEMVAPNDYIH